MTERFLRFLASLRLTLPLLFGLALGAVAGTVIPQNLTPAEYEGLYPAALTVVLKALQLFDVYRSWWFIALLGLLAGRDPQVGHGGGRSLGRVDEAGCRIVGNGGHRGLTLTRFDPRAPTVGGRGVDRESSR